MKKNGLRNRAFLSPVLSALLAILITLVLLAVFSLAVEKAGGTEIETKTLLAAALFLGCALAGGLRGRKEGMLPETLLLAFVLLAVLLSVAAVRGEGRVMECLRINALPVLGGSLAGGVWKLCKNHKRRKRR